MVLCGGGGYGMKRQWSNTIEPALISLIGTSVLVLFAWSLRGINLMWNVVIATGIGIMVLAARKICIKLKSGDVDSGK